MVQYQDELDKAFAALADPNRREILRRLGTAGSATVSELAGPLGMTLTGTKKHVRVLEDTGLVRTEKVGRSRHCTLGPQRLEQAERWIGLYRQMLEGRLDRLGELVEAGTGPDGQDAQPDAEQASSAKTDKTTTGRKER